MSAKGSTHALRVYAKTLGHRLHRDTARTMIQQRGEEGAREHLSNIIAIAAELKAAGLPHRLNLASMRLRTSGSLDAAVMRIRLYVERSHRRRSGVCIAVLTPAQTKHGRTNALAACGCPKCMDTLARELVDYTAVIIRNTAPLLDRDEARAICGTAMMHAAHTYPCAGSFTKWYAKIAETDLRRACGEAIQWDQLARLDAPLFVGDALAVTRYDRVADRTVDTFDIVAERDGVRHLIAGLRDWRDRTVSAYEAVAA